MSPYSMFLFANQAIQAGQENILNTTKKKWSEDSLRGDMTGRHGMMPPQSDMTAQRAIVAGQPDLTGWCPPWATARNNRINNNLKVQNRNKETDYLYSKAASKEHTNDPNRSRSNLVSAAHLTAERMSRDLLGAAAAGYSTVDLLTTADFLTTAVPIARKPTITAAAASAPSFFSMGPEEEVFDIELEDLATQVKKTVLLTPKNRTPGPIRPNSEKLAMAPARRNSRSNKPARKRSFQCEEVMEYAVDTYIWKLKLQEKYHVKGCLDTRHSGITGEMRQTLLQWLANVSRHLIFSLETWCLAVNYLDRFLNLQPVDKECLQLVGLTTLLIAAKIEEQNPPDILELVELCSSAYTRNNFKQMEVIILSKLKYKLLAPTPSFLLSHKIQVMGVKADWPADLSRHMVEMILSEPNLGFCIPSDIATAIYTVIKRSDVLMLREVSLNCPICMPAYGDVYIREFVLCCYKEICDYLIRVKQQDH